jgi:tetratricopeptide (TPR) repeat protein
VDLIMSRRQVLLKLTFINIAWIGAGLGLQPGLAQDNPRRESALTNPLEMKTPDPLLPIAVNQRSLSPLEMIQLQKDVESLDAQAIQEFKAGKKSAAFEIWFRELRLRRYLGPLDEIQALGRVGDTAWKESQATHVRVITERLQTLEQEFKSPPLSAQDLVIRQQALGQAYEQVRAADRAIGMYGQLVARARLTGDTATQEQALTAIAELYFQDFDYPQAAAAYQDLLTLVRSKRAAIALKPPRRTPTTHNPSQRVTPTNPVGEPLTELEILLQLAYIYEQDQKPEAAIAIEQQTIDLYQKAQDATPIPGLKLAIANNYWAINKVEQALAAYQETYNLAVVQQQYTYASEALQRLADYYRSQNQTDAALQMYQYLLDVQQQADNLMGRMEALDQIGQIHLARKDYPQALVAFRQGLELAQRLSYRQDYFTAQIERASQPQPQ